MPKMGKAKFRYHYTVPRVKKMKPQPIVPKRVAKKAAKGRGRGA